MSCASQGVAGREHPGLDMTVRAVLFRCVWSSTGIHLELQGGAPGSQLKDGLAAFAAPLLTVVPLYFFNPRSLRHIMCASQW